MKKASQSFTSADVKAMESVFSGGMYVGKHSLRGVETAEAPPAADEARLFRGSGTIGGADSAGNRIAATVAHYGRYAAKRGTERSESFSPKCLHFGEYHLCSRGERGL